MHTFWLVFDFLAHIEMWLVVTEALLVQVVVKQTVAVDTAKLLVGRNLRIRRGKNIANLLVSADLDSVLFLEVELSLLDFI